MHSNNNYGQLITIKTVLVLFPHQPTDLLTVGSLSVAPLTAITVVAFLLLCFHITTLLQLTFPQMLFLVFAAHAVDPLHRLHVTLVNGWWV